jgi:DNA-binding MarR family transcriptional regulator
MSLEAPTSPEEFLNYRLARLLASSSAPGIRLSEGRYNVSRREWRLVALIAVFGATSPSELASLAHLERPCVSRAIADLVAKGLLVRTGLPNDRRRARVDITIEGRQLYEELFPQVVSINSALLGALTPAQINAFDEILGLLTQAAEVLARSTPVTNKAARHLGGRRRALQPG